MRPHVEQRAEIGGAFVYTGQCGKGGPADRTAEPRARDRTRRLVELDRLDRAEPSEHREIVAGAAADLEDAGIFGRGDPALDQPRQYLAAGAIPPVAAVPLGPAIVDDP